MNSNPIKPPSPQKKERGMAVSNKWSVVIKVLLVVTVITSISLELNFALAQNETGTGEPSNSIILEIPGLKSTTPRKTRSNFTAAEFFYPIRPGFYRSHLPDRLTFEVNRDVTIEEFKERLAEQKWKTVYHCNGRAIPVKDFKNSPFLEGVINQSLIDHFSFVGNQGVLNQTLYPPETNTTNYPETETYSSNITKIDDLGNGRFRVDYVDYPSDVFSILKVRETGEMLIQGKIDGATKTCPDSKGINFLLVPPKSEPIA